MNNLTEEELKTLLLGNSITKTGEDELTLSNGTVLTLETNEGCGGCSAGWYYLDELNDMPDNIIMNVEFEEDHKGDSDDEDQYDTYKVFILAFDTRVKLWEVSGSEGNGYYGSGYWVCVKKVGEK